MNTLIGMYVLFNTNKPLCAVCKSKINKKCRINTYYATKEYGIDECMNCRISPADIINILPFDAIEGYFGA